MTHEEAEAWLKRHTAQVNYTATRVEVRVVLSTSTRSIAYAGEPTLRDAVEKLRVRIGE